MPEYGYVRLDGPGWSDAECKHAHMVLQKLYNGSVYIMGMHGPILLPVKDLVESCEDHPTFGWMWVTEEEDL